MPDESNLKTKVDNDFTAWAPLFDRHKTDADLFNLEKKYERVQDVNGDDIANSIWIVLNDPADYAWRVESVLNSAIEQAKVTSDNKRFDTAYAEAFIRAGYKGADELLSQKGEPPLNPFLDQQNFRRGSEAVFFYFHFENGVLIPQIQPWDTGYFVCKNDNKGIVYTGYKTTRSKDQILAEHPEAEGQIKDDISADLEVLYILSRETSELWVSGAKVKEASNRLGYVPVVYRRVPMGSMLKDKDFLKYQGESGLMLIRDLIPELNRLVSITQSLNLQELDHALQELRKKENQTPKGEPIPTTDQLIAPGAVVQTEGGFTKMPIGELRVQQIEVIHRDIKGRVDRVMTNFDAFPGQKTATEILALSQQRDTTILPRLVNRGLLKQDGAKMFIKQTITAAEKLKIKEVKLSGQTFEIAKLKGEYHIEFAYSFKDARLDAARQSLAVGQRGLVPDRDIRINTLQREDWQADERQLRWEEDERLSPLIKLDRNIRALLEDAKRGEPGAERQAKMLVLQMIPALKQAMAGMMTPRQPEEVQPKQPILPIFSESPVGGVRGNV